jgi:LacI family transcriptional regulator
MIDMKRLKNGQVTIKQVAREAGVSSQTVSRVVNNRPDVSPETRQKTQLIIDQLGYQPNAIARSLIHQRSNTLAVVAWGIDYYGPSRTVVGIEQKANELGYSLFLNLVDQPDDGNHERVLETLISRRVDGIIWAVPEVGNNRTWVISSQLRELPPIVFLSMESHPGISVIAIDNRNGARQAVQHLIHQGRRKIGILTGPLAWWEARERLAGWQEAMQEAELEPKESLVYRSDDWTAVNGERGMQTLWLQNPDMDAVFASNDQIALGAMDRAHQLGKNIPGELSIVGFDNIPEAAFFWPPLTTIFQQLIDVGCIAVENLHKMILERRSNPDHHENLSQIVRPKLIIRASSSKP